MGSLIIFIAGIWGATFTSKKQFLHSWYFLINLAFALYTAIFLTPFLVSLIEIKAIDRSYKIAISLFVLTIVIVGLLFKLEQQILPDLKIKAKIPVIAEKTGTLFSLFFTGIIIMALVLFCFTTLPVSKRFPLPPSIRSASVSTLKGVVNTINAFSFQTLSDSGRNTLVSVGLTNISQNEPKDKVSEQTEAEEQTTPEQAETKEQTTPENKN